MTDHLEPYRRMARSICFVPPQWQAERFYRALTQSSTGTPTFAVSGATAPSTVSSLAKLSASAPDSDPGPTPDPSEYIAALVRDAVSKPSVLVTSYNIPENIGDRIGKLARPLPRTAIAPLPKLPEPDSNWAPAPEVAPVPSEAPITALNKSPVEVKVLAPAIAPDADTNDLSDLEIVISTAEPTTRLEISQPIVSPPMDALDKTPVTATKADKRGNRKQAQGFSPNKKQRKA